MRQTSGQISLGINALQTMYQNVTIRGNCGSHQRHQRMTKQTKLIECQSMRTVHTIHIHSVREIHIHTHTRRQF